MATFSLIPGNNIQSLASLPENSVHCIVTSPPYFPSLRSYGGEKPIWPDGWQGSLGDEPTPEAFCSHLVSIFAACRRVLRPDGSLWVNIGDSYAKNNKYLQSGIKRKDLFATPFLFALTMRKDGWYLRNDQIWCLSGGTLLYAKINNRIQIISIQHMVKDYSPKEVELWNGEKWVRVARWWESPREDSPLEIKLRSGQKIGCSSRHVFPTSSGMKKAGDLRIGDMLCQCKLPEQDIPESPEHIPDSMGWLIGIYLAEGCQGDGYLRFSIHKKEQYIYEKIRNIAAQYGGSVSIHPNSENGVDVHLYSTVIRAIVSLFIHGRNAREKFLKPRCFRRSNDFLKHLMNGYLAGDGSWESVNKRWRLGFARNDVFANNLRTVCNRLGYSLRLNTGFSKNTKTGQIYKTHRGQLRTEASNRFKNDMEIVALSKSRGRRFFDIEIDDESHVFALSSGVLTHNSKPDVNPESVKDRCVRSHEYIFHFTKESRYYFDHLAIREAASAASLKRIAQKNFAQQKGGTKDYGKTGINVSRSARKTIENFAKNPGRNKRTVWNMPTARLREGHFAAFPVSLPKTCILASTSEVGCCPKCGNPWTRLVNAQRIATRPALSNKVDDTGKANRDKQRHVTVYETNGWQPSCDCGIAEKVPAVVLDPFNGAGTTGVAALEVNRNYIGMELVQSYIDISMKRLNETVRKMNHDIRFDY